MAGTEANAERLGLSYRSRTGYCNLTSILAYQLLPLKTKVTGKGLFDSREPPSRRLGEKDRRQPRHQYWQRDSARATPREALFRSITVSVSIREEEVFHLYHGNSLDGFRLQE